MGQVEFDEPQFFSTRRGVNIEVMAEKKQKKLLIVSITCFVISVVIIGLMIWDKRPVSESTAKGKLPVAAQRLSQ
jgi:hypothetical protein